MVRSAFLVTCVALAGCGGQSKPLPWQEHELGVSRARRGGVARPTGTLADAEQRLDAAIAAGDARAIVAAAVDVGGLGGGERVATERAVVRAAIDELEEDELEAMVGGTSEPQGAIALRLALLAHHRGEDAAARKWLGQVATTDDGREEAIAARTKALEAEVGKVDATLVAVLLPLSGRFAAIGKELRAAIELVPREGAVLVFVDTAGGEQGAVDAVDRAAARGAVAILGPVGERESVAAARRAAELGIPIGLLSPSDGADPEAGVFRLAASPADEARAAARVAAKESFPTAAVFAPRDDVGAVMAEAFVEEAKARGIVVARSGTYDPTGSDLQADIKELLDLVPARNPRLAKHLRRYGKKGWQTFSPDVDFSLLYVPDGHDRAALVAAFLPYLGVELHAGDPDMLARKHGGRIPQVVQLLGSSGWNHPGLITRGGEPVAGAMFVDVCAGVLDAGVGGEIAARLRDAMGREPSTAALEAYDAARLVFAARARGGEREGVRRAMAGARLDEGACPAATMQGGELQREPVVFVVEDGERAIVAY